MLVPRLTRALDMESARKLTVKDAIEAYAKGSGEKRACYEALQGYSKAWELAWPGIKHFVADAGEEVGERIPDKFRDISVSEASPITLLLASDRDEGRCAAAITMELVKRHNEFLSLVAVFLRNTGQELLHIASSAGQGGAASAAAAASFVSPRFLTQTQAISYDLEGRFVPFVMKQCVDHTAEGASVYNFDNAQQYLMDTYFIGKPLVDAHETSSLAVQYADDADAIDVAAIARRVPQDELTSDMRDSILGELRSGAAALKCLQLLETVIAFVTATATTSASSSSSKVSSPGDLGEVLISTYMRETLLMEDAAGAMESKTIEQQVRLKHVASLWATLRSVLVKSRFQDVHMSYKHPIDAKRARGIKADILDCKEIADDATLEALLAVMQSTIATILVEGTHDPSKAAADFMEHAELDGKALKTYSWFQKGFPKAVPLRYIVDLVQVIEAAKSELKINLQ